MGTLVEKNALRTILLEILSKDKTLLKEILKDLLKHDPQLLEEFTSTNQSMLVNEPSVVYKAKEKSAQNPETEGVSDEELDFWVDKHFTEYEAVFKALA
jgi:Na+-translocating ferredoxin:NAD+ oxidoreductase RnfG subunit